MPTSGARQFLYLDSHLTLQLLAGLEQGVYDVERVTSDESAERRVGGKAGASVMGVGLGAEAGKTSSLARRSETDLEQTSESQFSRLVAGLRNHDALTQIDTPARSSLEKLRPGDVIEIVGSMTIHDPLGLGTAVASMQLDGGFRGKLSGLTVSAYKALRAIPGIPVDPEISATSPGAGDVRFSGRLDARQLRTKLDNSTLHGTVLAKLERPLDDDASITVIGIYR